MKYARNSTVSKEKTKANIERILASYGADQFISGYRDVEAFE